MNCVVDCPFNCILSDWAPWTECSHTCGSKGESQYVINYSVHLMRAVAQEEHCTVEQGFKRV